MKPTELLNSLDYVGADLLAEAEQNVLVRTRRPWLKTAIAAVLVAAVGVGGVLTLKHFSMRGTVSDPVPVATNTTETVYQTEKLPTLELENSWQMLPGRLTVVSGDLSLCADNITSLPVYANRMSEGSDGMYYYYNEEQMRSMLDEAVRRLGANPVGEVEVGHDSDGSVYYLELNTDDGIVAVKPDGSISVDLLDGKYDIDPERAESSEDLSLADGAPLKNDILACVQRDQALLGLSENQMVLFDGELHDVYLFPAREDPTEQLLVRSFGAVSQGMASSLSSMDFLDWYQRPDSTDWNNTEHDWLSLIGWYPTLTLAEAKEMALAGQGMCVENMDVNLTEDRITGVELVYPRMDCHITMIPYYRFWFSRSFQTIYGDNSDFYVCVPAIRPEFLTDWQPDSDPHTPNEAPVFTIRADYHYFVSGYAGDVDALQFPGHEPRDEVTADVDGDGNKELVYLYTDGSRFVGIAAYGLDDGRPVLKAADMLSLNGRTARLELDEVGGNVWFFLISNSANQNGTGANTCQSVLTVQDGAIVLSGSLPEDCRIEADTPFTMIRNDRDSYFTNGRIMVWDLYTNGIIVRQNMITGESETLFELEIIDDTTTSLLAVTDQRLYFGTNHPESTQFTGVYSVNYQNTDRTEIAQYRELTCEDGWIILRDSDDDVASAQIVIDRSDRKVLDLAKCRNGAVVDGSYYYIYAPAEQDADALNALSEEARNELYRHMQYEVCKLDPDGTGTKIGTIESDYANAYFQIDAQKKEIICSEYDAETGTNNFRHLDLFTLAPKDDTANTNEPAEDPHSLVAEALSVQGSYTDGLNNVFDYSFSIPKLNSHSEDAEAINQEIDEKYGDYIRQIQSAEDGGDRLVISEISYEVAIWGDVVSMVITEPTYWHTVNYDVYCYDCSTHRRLDTAALLEKMGISQEAFLDTCKTRFREKYLELTFFLSEEERIRNEEENPDFLPDSPRFVNMDLQIFPSDTGELTAIAPITSWAGAAFYYYLVPLGIGGGN